MINPVAGGRLVVSGSRMASVAGGPSPGRMPTSVPITTPTATQKRLIGLNAAPKPSIRLLNAPMTLSFGSGLAEQGGCRQVDAEQEREDRVDRGGYEDGHQHRPDAPDPLDREDEVRHQDHHRWDEADERHHRDADEEPDPDPA